mgnify:CR=1 FL=1
MFTDTIDAVIDRVDAIRHKVDDHWQIPRDEAQVLAGLVLAMGATSICEIGCSYGFSTLHLAGAVAINGGRLHGFDLSEKKVNATTTHLAEAGLQSVATIHHGDARQTVKAFVPERPYDFVFIDATKAQSFGYLEAVTPHLAPRAVLATDNTISHRDELTDFVAHLRALEGAHSVEVPVGNGFELTIVRR